LQFLRGIRNGRKRWAVHVQCSATTDIVYQLRFFQANRPSG